ncbi:LOW QUALITY PROTEIN: myosin-A-like, partial [Ochotona princeps]|uniref:LOW QUALITY PROTEIN: myosin-A-like n=1 Tax=Ochotona princeps TaxID=9978 RepID=UPI00271513A2
MPPSVSQLGAAVCQVHCILLLCHGRMQPYEILIEDAYNSNFDIDIRGIPDIGHLAHKNCAAVLDFLRARYMEDLIYTTADPLLIATNPFRDLQNTGPQWIQKYHASTSPEPPKEPHVFQIARTALERLHSFDSSQTIIVSGESGAGKTEATKQLMAFLAYVKNERKGNIRIQEAVMAANPILEAFGNAKTTRNNNSSRFGRFMQLQVGPEGGILYGFIRNFLLEKVRVTQLGVDERSYHVFYQLLSGASTSLKTTLHLLRPDEYVYLKGSGCYLCPNTDDAADFRVVGQTFEKMNFRPDEVNSIWSILSGILLLGNVEFQKKETEGVPDAADLTPEKKALLSQCCELLFIDSKIVEKEFLFNMRVIGNQEIQSPVSVSKAQVNRDSLAKALYEKLFDWIVLRLNQRIQPPRWFQIVIGLLDIFGFEVFQHNSLEQLLINITNEKLQKAFIQIVFSRVSA